MPRNESLLPIIITGMNEPWEKITHLGTRERFPKRSVVAGGGADVDGIYYLVRGLVRLSCITRAGKEYAMLYMGEGMLFNENDIFHKGLNNFLTSIEPLETVFFPRAMLNEQFFGEHPDLAMNLISSMSQKTRVLYSLLGATRSLDSFAHVCRVLYRMHLFNRVQEAGSSKSRIVPRLCQQELAAFLGMHRASMHTAISRLKEERIIERYSKKELIITDLPALERYVMSNMTL